MSESPLSQSQLFASSLVESTSLLRSHNRWPAVISVVTQAALVAALLAIPMLYPEVMPLGPVKLNTLSPPPPPTPPPPMQRPHVLTSMASTASAASTRATVLLQNLIHLTSPTVDAPVLAASLSVGPAAPGIPLGLNPTAPNVVAASVKPGPPARISSGVSAGLLLAPIRPDYPPIARATRTEGTVVIQAIMSKSGRIERARVMSGPPMLQGAALDAVRSARYHPYLLNNEPTEVETTISIIFHLSS